jgi:replicative DNA helicase
LVNTNESLKIKTPNLQPMTPRLHFEIAILGACMLEQSAYPQVMDVLKPQNFTQDVNGIDHQKMFAVMQSLYPTSPINMTTVAVRLPGYGYTIAEYTSRVSSAACLRHDALLLLEFNFRDSFIQLLRNSKTNKTVVQAAIAELIDEALDGDIFEIVENACDYLTLIGASEEAETILQLQAQIDSRIEKIKEAAKIESLFAHLQSLVPAASSHSKMAMAKLVELTKQILVTGSLEKNQLTKLLAI